MDERASRPSTFISAGAEAYEDLMGRWSRRLADPFVEFAGMNEGERVLDLGCGTGNLCVAIGAHPVAAVTGIDLSETYVAFARSRSEDPRFTFQIGDACALPFVDHTFDRSLSMLVLNFVPDARAATAEMIRVTRPGGVVAAAIWDLRGGLPVFGMFWDTVAVLDPAAAMARDRYFSSSYTRAGELAAAWSEFGLRDVVQDQITIRMDFENFEDYWRPLTGKTGTAGAYVAGVSEAMQSEIKAQLRRAYRSGGEDGPRSFASTAWVCRGRVPQ